MPKFTSRLRLNVNSLFQKTVPNAKVGFSKAMQAGWIQMDKKAEGGPRVFKKVTLQYEIDIFTCQINMPYTTVSHFSNMIFLF